MLENADLIPACSCGHCGSNVGKRMALEVEALKAEQAAKSSGGSPFSSPFGDGIPDVLDAFRRDDDTDDGNPGSGGGGWNVH